MTLIGAVSANKEFMLGGRTFKWIGPLLYGKASPVREHLYQLQELPNAKDGTPLVSHQNSILVQEKETGAFFLAECWDECDPVHG